MAHFFVKLIAPRPTFAMDMSDAEKELMQEHFAYWRGRQDQGDVLVFGPVMDPKGPYGMGIIAADDVSGAQAFTAADPAIRANIGFACEIHPMQAVTPDRPTP